MVSCKTLVELLQANKNTMYQHIAYPKPALIRFWRLKTYEVSSFTANSYASIALAVVKTKQQ